MSVTLGATSAGMLGSFGWLPGRVPIGVAPGPRPLPVVSTGLPIPGWVRRGRRPRRRRPPVRSMYEFRGIESLS
jgi:hypothetical protein